MAIDKDMQRAIEVITSELDQPKNVARQIVAWMEDLSNRELKVEEELVHLQSVMQAIKLPDS